MTTPEQARRRLREIRASWAYAFANGHACTAGPRPELEPVLREADELAAIIAEHDPAALKAA